MTIKIGLFAVAAGLLGALLFSKENGSAAFDENPVSVFGNGVEVPPSNDERSPETYVGYGQAERFGSPEEAVRDSRRTYSAPASISLNHWALVGSWNVGSEAAVLQSVPGKVLFWFHSRDLNLILAPAKGGKPVRFQSHSRRCHARRQPRT